MCGQSPTCKPCRIETRWQHPKFLNQPTNQVFNCIEIIYLLAEINPQGSPQLLLRKAISSKCVLNCSAKIAIPQMEVHRFHFQAAQETCLPLLMFLIESKSSFANMNPDQSKYVEVCRSLLWFHLKPMNDSKVSSQPLGKDADAIRLDLTAILVISIFQTYILRIARSAGFV